MRLRPVVATVVSALLGSLGPVALVAQQATDPLADGLVPGNYIRVGASSVTPVSPQGSLKDWNRGVGFGVTYENWDQGRSGVGRIGYGFMVDYALLPFNDAQFVRDFIPLSGTTQSASAKRAGVFQAGVNLRIRIPAPYIMPSVFLQLGFLNWHPGQITYTTTTFSTPQTAKQESRSGGLVAIGGSLDKHIYDRFAIFGEALYTYAYTSFGQGLGASGSQCVASNCDLLKNTPLGSIRGGLRVRVGN
jgi:hypothetical protein